MARAYGVLAPSGIGVAVDVLHRHATAALLDIDKKVSAASHGADVATRLRMVCKLERLQVCSEV